MRARNRTVGLDIGADIDFVHTKFPAFASASQLIWYKSADNILLLTEDLYRRATLHEIGIIENDIKLLIQWETANCDCHPQD